MARFGFVLGLCLLSCTPSKDALSAGEVGCRPEEISVYGDSYGVGTESWTASCNGKTFICTRTTDSFLPGSVESSNVSCKESQSGDEETAQEAEQDAGEDPAPEQATAEAKPKGAEPPGGAAGFEFGATKAAIQRSCEAAGQTWTAKEQSGRCSGAASDVGLKVEVFVDFCAEHACVVTVQHRPNENWPGAATALKDRLIQRYGWPTEFSTPLPRECESEAAFLSCLESEKLQHFYRWSFSNGSGVRMTVGKSRPGEAPAIRVNYAQQESSSKAAGL